ncbi:MAG: hypothetical protein ACYTFQ_00190 [Planctomycetota bacterium]|jgi:hypothetical protein
MRLTEKKTIEVSECVLNADEFEALLHVMSAHWVGLAASCDAQPYFRMLKDKLDRLGFEIDGAYLSDKYECTRPRVAADTELPLTKSIRVRHGQGEV